MNGAVPQYISGVGKKDLSQAFDSSSPCQLPAVRGTVDSRSFLSPNTREVR